MKKFADVRNDIAFHKIFANENRKDSLISFLNAVLEFEGERTIKEVDIVPPNQLPSLRGGKVTIVDVKAKDQLDRQFIVEMQVIEKESFSKRALYYISHGYVHQIQRGDDYRKLNPAYFIGILDFIYTQNPSFISRSRIQDVVTAEVTIRDMEFNFIELPKFNLKEEELKTTLEEWVFFIKNAPKLIDIPKSVDDPGLRSAYEEANQHTWTQAQLDTYDYVFMREEDGRAELDAAENRGKKMGLEEGRQEGIVQGKLETARAMKALGLDRDTIQKATGLSDQDLALL